MLLTFLLFIAALTQKGEGNTLRGLTTVPPCAVQSFTIYEFEKDGSARETYLSSTLDLTDFAFGKCNYFAKVTEGCNPKCVKLSLAGYERKELTSPYALYGDMSGKPLQGAPRQSGRHQLKACLYTDKACTMGEHGCLTSDINIIPADEPLEAGPFALEPFSITFNNVDEGSVSEEETKVAAQTLCQVITKYWDLGAWYRCDVGVNDFECDGVLKPTSSTNSTTIEFSTSASVGKGVGFNPYCNRRLPDSDEVFHTMTHIFVNNWPIAPYSPGSRDLFVKLLPTNNPYRSVTTFTLITV